MFPILLVALFWSGSQSVFSDAQIKDLRELAQVQQQTAVQINALASRIHTEADANELITLIAKASEPYPAHFGGLLRQAASAEYWTATGKTPGIGEEHIANVWNDYVREIGAADETLISVAELHALRKAIYMSSQLFWTNGARSIWTVPSLYAVAQDGRIAAGCRFLESLRLLQELRRFDNLRATRDLSARGIKLPDTFTENSMQPPQKKSFLSAVPAHTNPVDVAERRYIEEQGMSKFEEVQQRVLDKLLAGLARHQ